MADLSADESAQRVDDALPEGGGRSLPIEKTAIALIVAYVIVIAAVTPWRHQPLAAAPPVIAILTSGLVVSELATTVLLMGWFIVLPFPPLLWFGCAYLFSALMAVFHLLSFPGAILMDRPLIGGAQLAGFEFNVWRLGFVLLLMAGVISPWRRLADSRRRDAIVLGLGAVLTGFVAIAATGLFLLDALPPFGVGAQFTNANQISGWVAFGLGLTTLYLLFRFKAPYPNLRIWLAIVLVTFCGALFLGTSSGGRFTVGWYAGRSSGFISGLVLFLFLLGEALSQQQKALQGARLQRAQALRLQIETERRAQSEARLVQAQKLEAIGQLSGGIAHDFNNLLAAIVGGLELVKRTADLTPKQNKWIDGALSAAHRGAKLTKQLLIFSRGQRLELKPVVVADLALGMRELLARTLGPQIEVEMRFENSNAAAMSEPTQLELAILNLAVNARDAMPEGGKLRIGTRAMEIENDRELKDGAYLEISVADAGSGMAPEIAAQAFDPFFTTKASGKGAGLGLAQVAEIANRAGGAARIESALGKGTVVRVFLPIVDLFAPEALAPILGLSVQASGADVLVIDDDAAVREIMVGILTALGASVREAADGERGLAMIDEAEPDLMVVDFAMPRMNGAEVARAARLRHPDLRIVFVTGYADADAIERATGPHALILRKPFRDTEFHAILAEALSAKATAA